jgi:hypothetical protein
MCSLIIRGINGTPEMKKGTWTDLDELPGNLQKFPLRDWISGGSCGVDFSIGLSPQTP